MKGTGCFILPNLQKFRPRNLRHTWTEEYPGTSSPHTSSCHTRGPCPLMCPEHRCQRSGPAPQNTTNNYIHVDSIQAYTLHRQYSFHSLHKPSIGHSYNNLAHDHHTWSLMASVRSYISRWPDNVGRRQKGTNSK